MISGNERLIIISGMAHSGTTILTYLIKQHPDLFCHTDGQESWLLENSLLFECNSDGIQNLLNHNPKRIILKRTWCFKHYNWLNQQMPNAKYIYCLRDFDPISASWSKPNSFVSNKTRTSNDQKSIYDLNLECAMKLKSMVSHFQIVRHVDLLLDPKHVMSNIGEWLNIHYDWDTSVVSKIDIKSLLHMSAFGVSFPE